MTIFSEEYFQKKNIDKNITWYTKMVYFVHSSTATNRRRIHCSSTVVLYRDIILMQFLNKSEMQILAIDNVIFAFFDHRVVD